MFTFVNNNGHLYTLASTDKKVRERVYFSRQEAKNDMYDYIDRKGLRVVKKYDDKHFKTYICDDGTMFYINRV